VIQEMTDLRKPFLWYPLARQIAPREIIMHVGPTNSGKTHSAIEHLIQAQSGVYCGPLRLLAQEVYQKLTDRGIKCDMVTGQKVISIDGARHVACTVEMANVREVIDVAVIDEYQLIGDQTRGWAWTRALLGIPARTIHLCGDLSAVELVEQMVKETGDNLTVKKYERLSPLKPQKEALSPPIVDGIEAGDCIVTFSKKELYRTKVLIERNTKFQCCVVYGDLPPDTRAEQASLFNDPDSGFDVLIATDAIGLGLNLNIRRIVFSTIEKFDGQDMRQLTVPEIKQIAGRAGRFKSLYPVGEVTAFDRDDLSVVKKALKVEIGPMNPHLLTRSAGVLPQFEQLESLHAVMGREATFVDVLDMFDRMATTDKHYFLCRGDPIKEVAQLLQHVPLSLRDLYSFCMAPVDVNNEVVAGFLIQFAENFAEGIPVSSPPLSRLMKAAKSKISSYETAFKVVDLYLWLSYRFPTFFMERDDAEKLKDQISQTVTNLLLFNVDSSSQTLGKRAKLSRSRKDGAAADSSSSHSKNRRRNAFSPRRDEDEHEFGSNKDKNSKKHFKMRHNAAAYSTGHHGDRTHRRVSRRQDRFEGGFDSS
jgi:ATP-dependent RNA helicase SUPV3L1/SUV3